MNIRGAFILAFSILLAAPISAAGAEQEYPFPVQIGEKKFVYRDKTGKDPFGETYELACPFSGGLAAVKKGGKWGFLDPKGKAAIPFAFDGVHPKTQMSYRIPQEDQCGGFTGEVAAVKRGNRWGMIDRSGKYLVEPEYFDVAYAAYAVASDNTLVNSKEGSWFFSRIEMYVMRLGDRRWDFVKESDIIVELKPEGPPRVILNKDPARKALVASFSGKLKRVSRGGKYGFEDGAGKTVIPPTYADARDFAEGLAPVNTGGKWGYIDNTGKMVIEPRFGYAMEFSGGMAAVQVGKDVGYIDNTGTVVIEPKYQFGYNFQGVKARVLLWNGTFRYIDKKGEFLP